jgi:hypothetical protein
MMARARQQLGYRVAFLGLWGLAAVAGCGGSPRRGELTGPDGGGSDGTGGAGGNPMAGMGGAGGAMTGDCSDLFAPTLQKFSIDISASDWSAIQAEFLSAGMLTLDTFVNYQPHYYPVVLHFGGDASNNAYMRLKGDSSWRDAVTYDGANGKMQFVVTFDQLDSTASFHGVGKIAFDMPRADFSFLHDRIGNTWMRSAGIAALCATSARLDVNGSYYGLYVVEEKMGHRIISEFFPGNGDGDLFKGGRLAETNQSNPDWDHLSTFWHATTPAALAAVVDLPTSFLTWAGEMLLNDGDGYWGGDHNFYLYDQGSKGYVFLPSDLDSILDFLPNFQGDPVWWWSARRGVQFIGPQYIIVMSDATMRSQYATAVATQLGHFDVAKIQSWIDQWSAQIRDSVGSDPHRPSSTTLAMFDAAVAAARAGVKTRADLATRWLACEQSGSGEDKDGDGYISCKDCDDGNASTHPGAAEICGNMIDDNCDGNYDEGCPGGPPPPNGGAH